MWDPATPVYTYNPSRDYWGEIGGFWGSEATTLAKSRGPKNKVNRDSRRHQTFISGLYKHTYGCTHPTHVHIPSYTSVSHKPDVEKYSTACSHSCGEATVWSHRTRSLWRCHLRPRRKGSRWIRVQGTNRGRCAAGDWGPQVWAIWAIQPEGGFGRS